MRRHVPLLGLWTIALLMAVRLPVYAQQQETQAEPSNETFRWIDFHAPKDQDILVWVTRAMQVDDWTAIREIGVQWDAALVITSKRSTPQSLPSSDAFNIWSVSLTTHLVRPLLTGVNLRIFEWQRFADGTAPELPVLYDNCRECAANTYFTALYYDVRDHAWAARWLRGTQGVPVWNANPPSAVNWTQVYAVMGEGDGHVELTTWNHFDYGKQKPPEDFVYRYDIDSLGKLDRSILLTSKTADAMEMRLCKGQDAVEGLARGQDSALCQQLIAPQVTRKPVTSPPANNRGQSSAPAPKRHETANHR